MTEKITLEQLLNTFRSLDELYLYDISEGFLERKTLKRCVTVRELLDELAANNSRYLSYTVENATIWCGGLIVEISGNEGQ